jgi:hypothetical protein
MRKKKDKFDKYNFSNSVTKNNYNSSFKNKESFFETIKIWIINMFQFLIYHWIHNRMLFLLVLSLIFILGYYIYTNYIKDDDKDEDNDDKDDKDEILNNLVKNNNKKFKNKNGKKRIPKKHETRCRIIMENLYKKLRARREKIVLINKKLLELQEKYDAYIKEKKDIQEIIKNLQSKIKRCKNVLCQ